MAVTVDIMKTLKSQRLNMGKLQRREAMAGIFMSLPFVLGFLLLTLGPMLVGLYASFTRWDIVSRQNGSGWITSPACSAVGTVIFTQP
jgi:ABC-type sugar transport system permease subunit